MTETKAIEWTVGHEGSIQFSDGTFLSSWVRLWEGEEEVKRSELKAFSTLHPKDMESKHWEATFSRPLQSFYINMGMRSYDPYIIFSENVEKSFTLQNFIRRIRKEMTRRLTPTEINHYRNHTRKYFGTDAPVGESYTDLLHDEEPFLYLVYHADTKKLEVNWCC